MISTIKQVAEKAGVSISTVSKVLKNYTNISEETRTKVLKAVKELNYVPNSTASHLSSKNKDKVALYIYINDNGKKLYILECREQMLVNILKFAKRTALEKDYVMQEKKQKSIY